MTADATPAADVQPKARIFISYSRKDMAFADRLEAALNVRGFEPLIDRTEIYAFEDWWKRIEGLIGRADTVVFVLSPDAVASEVALKEVAHATSLNKRFAPIVCRRTDDRAVPEALRRLNFVFFDDPARFEASADQLAAALNTDIAWVRQHTEYGEAARRWAAGGHKSGLLLRSPVLEEAERWIASRPRGAPEPTAETQAFVTESRHGASKRRNILTVSLAAGLLIALVLAGLAYWQREVAVQQQQIADQQRKRAEDTLAAATQTANSLVFDLTRRFRDTEGIPASLIKDILDRARALQQQLIKSGEATPDLKRSEALVLDDTAVSLRAIGKTKDALAAAEQARQIAADLLAKQPSNAGLQRDLSVTDETVGDLLVAQGNLSEALKSYRNSLTIRVRLAQADPGNTMWETDLSVAYDKVAGVLRAQGNLSEALNSYRDALAISDRLARADPDNSGLQRDLGVSGARVGDVLMAQGNLSDALKFYLESLSIADRLARTDSGNVGWQHDLYSALDHVSDVEMQQGNSSSALGRLNAGRTIMEQLAHADPGNAGWQRDLSSSYGKIGIVLQAQGHLPEALSSYREALAIFERLAHADPDNADWQRDLAVAYSKIGDVLKAQGNLPEALESYEDLLATAERMVRANPGNVYWQRGLSESRDKIGDVFVARGDLTDALESYRNSLAIRQRLLSTGSSTVPGQRDLSSSINRIGGLAYSFLLARDFAGALAAADQAIAVTPEQTWLYTNRAHALMFLGRTDEARALYLKYRGVKDVTDGKPWIAVILEDFADLRKKGLTNPLMDEIEKLFTSAG
jgi:tetratricopeptide (TPR) repeat protein